VAVFELAYRRLPEPAARVFRLLPAHPGLDVSVATVEVLADRPASEVRRALAALAQMYLVEAAPGGTGRWWMHDLVRLYARHLSDAHVQADGREQVLDRLLGYYLSMTEAADDQVRGRPDLSDPAAFTSPDEALAWLDTERPSLIAAVGMAADTGRDQAAASLPLFLAQYLARRQLFDDLLTITTIGLSAARRLGDRDLEGSALTNLGLAQQELRRPIGAGGSAGTMPRARAGRPAGSGPGRSGGAAPRSRAAGPGARHPWTPRAGPAASGSRASACEQAGKGEDHSAMIPARKTAQGQASPGQIE
jgi:hypothetical protein